MNRGKRSVVLDLKDPDGLAKLFELLADADVFLCNWRGWRRREPRAHRRGVRGVQPAPDPRARSPATARTARSRRSRAFDTAVQARSGLMDALSPDGVPRILPGYPVDKITALMATQAVLAALYERERTGRGERIDLAMLDAAASVNFPDLFTNRVFLRPPARRPAQPSPLHPAPAARVRRLARDRTRHRAPDEVRARSRRASRVGRRGALDQACRSSW